MSKLFGLFLGFAITIGGFARADVVVNDNRPMQKYSGHVEVVAGKQLIRFATYNRVYFLKFPPVAARNQFQLRDLKPGKEIVLEFLDDEVDHIEPLTAADQKAWK